MDERQRRDVLEAMNADFAAMRGDLAAWAEEQAERAAWDPTLADGLHTVPWRESGARKRQRLRRVSPLAEQTPVRRGRR